MNCQEKAQKKRKRSIMSGVPDMRCKPPKRKIRSLEQEPDFILVEYFFLLVEAFHKIFNFIN